MAKKWIGITKIAEECGELIQELMKLHSYPNGKHPRRKTNLIRSTEDEIADLYATLDYFVAKHKLNAEKIKRRRAYKFRKWVKRWGDVPKSVIKKAAKKQAKKTIKKAVTKKRAVGQSPSVDASTHVTTS